MSFIFKLILLLRYTVLLTVSIFCEVDGVKEDTFNRIEFWCQQFCFARQYEKLQSKHENKCFSLCADVGTYVVLLLIKYIFQWLSMENISVSDTLGKDGYL